MVKVTYGRVITCYNNDAQVLILDIDGEGHVHHNEKVYGDFVICSADR